MTYLDVNLNYSQNTQGYKRQLVSQENNREVKLPLVLTAGEARTIAERTLILQWGEGTETVKLELPPALLYVEVGDILILPGSDIPLEIIQLNIGANFRISVECRPFDKQVLNFTRSLTQLNPIDFTPLSRGIPYSVRTSARGSSGVVVTRKAQANIVYREGIDYNYVSENSTITILPRGNIEPGEKLSIIGEEEPETTPLGASFPSHTSF